MRQLTDRALHLPLFRTDRFLRPQVYYLAGDEFSDGEPDDVAGGVQVGDDALYLRAGQASLPSSAPVSVRKARSRSVGVDKEHDRARGLAVSTGGVTVVSKGQVVAP